MRLRMVCTGALLLMLAAAAFGQTDNGDEITPSEYMAWQVEHVPYKLRLVQQIDDYLLLSQDTIPRATVGDMFIIIKSRIMGRGIRQIRYGRPGRPMTILDRSKLYQVFSESFVRTLMDKEKYYFIEWRIPEPAHQ